MTLTVWSEQGEAKWRDCMHASILMLMVFGGVLPAKFKLGINSSAERERFEDSEGLPESQQEQGLVGYSYTDLASWALYDATAHDATEAELPGLLATVGVAIALTGNGPGLPPTPQYPSGFQGNHSITVVPLGGGMVTLLDPLQRSGTTFSPFPVATVLVWHRHLVYGQDIRYVREGELANVTATPPSPNPGGNMDVVTVSPVSQVNCAAGGSLRDANTGAVISAKWTAQTRINTWGRVGTDTIILVQTRPGGPPVAARYPTALCTAIVAGADPAAAVAAAIAPLNAKIAAAKAALS